MSLSNTTLLMVCIYIYRIYYIKINYVFRLLTIAIFRLRLKNFITSYTRHIYTAHICLVQLLTKFFNLKLKMAIVKGRNM